MEKEREKDGIIFNLERSFILVTIIVVVVIIIIAIIIIIIVIIISKILRLPPKSV